MAKERCRLCGQSKAKRTCKIKGDIGICPVCCSTIRSDQCLGCTYYEASVRYRSEKFEKPQKEKPFIPPIYPEIEEECDRILSMVEAGHLLEGEKEMRKLYHKHPNYHTVLYGMGVCSALEKRDFISAINLYRRVLETDPKHVQSWGNLGLAYAGIGERGKALECLDKALELNPEYEIAPVNQLKDGERFEGNIESVDYYRDYKVKGKKSYIAETIKNLFRKDD